MKMKNWKKKIETKKPVVRNVIGNKNEPSNNKLQEQKFRMSA